MNPRRTAYGAVLEPNSSPLRKEATLLRLVEPDLPRDMDYELPKPLARRRGIEPRTTGFGDRPAPSAAAKSPV